MRTRYCRSLYENWALQIVAWELGIADLCMRARYCNRHGRSLYEKLKIVVWELGIADRCMRTRYVWTSSGYDHDSLSDDATLRNICISWFCQLLGSKTFFKKLFFKTTIVSILIIYTKYILRLIGWEWLLCFYKKIFLIIRHFRLTQFSVWRGSKCTIFSLDWLKIYAKFSYTEIGNFPDDFIPLNKIRDRQFWYTKTGNLPDDFMLLNEWHHFFHRDRQVSRQVYVFPNIRNFYRVGILHFSSTLKKN